ncbi:MAG: GNAT family N-acetyltransferase [Gaiellaceae bacterium]
MGIAGAVPYRVETARLVVRCYEPKDAPLLKDAVERSRDHLWPWMPWTPAEPEPLDYVVLRLREFRAQFDRDENWIYGVFTPDEARVVGGSGFHARGGEGSLEIGYWIAVDAARRGYTTEVAAVLTRVGFEQVGLDRVDIQIDPANQASQGIPRKLGFVHEGTLRRRLPRREGEPRADSMVFTMLREEYDQASWRDAYPYAAFDAVGNRV